MGTLKKRKYSLSKKLLLIPAAVLLIIVILFILEKRGVTNIYTKNDPVNDKAKTTSTAKTAQENFTDGDDRQPGNSEGQNEGNGVITDNHGSIDSGTNTSNPSSSSTGEITVYSPAKNSIVSSGSAVAGKSSLSSVSFRLIDNVSGIIASGSISVVDGKFSGKLSFSTSGSEGRLDFYGTRADGTEYSNVEIPLRFK